MNEVCTGCANCKYCFNGQCSYGEPCLGLSYITHFKIPESFPCVDKEVRDYGEALATIENVSVGGKNMGVTVYAVGEGKRLKDEGWRMVFNKVISIKETYSAFVIKTAEFGCVETFTYDKRYYGYKVVSE